MSGRRARHGRRWGRTAASVPSASGWVSRPLYVRRATGDLLPDFANRTRSPSAGPVEEVEQPTAEGCPEQLAGVAPPGDVDRDDLAARQGATGLEERCPVLAQRPRRPDPDRGGHRLGLGHLLAGHEHDLAGPLLLDGRQRGDVDRWQVRGLDHGSGRGAEGRVEEGDVDRCQHLRRDPKTLAAPDHAADLRVPADHDPVPADRHHGDAREPRHPTGPVKHLPAVGRRHGCEADVCEPIGDPRHVTEHHPEGRGGGARGDVDVIDCEAELVDEQGVARRSPLDQQPVGGDVGGHRRDGTGEDPAVGGGRPAARDDGDEGHPEDRSYDRLARTRRGTPVPHRADASIGAVTDPAAETVTIDLHGWAHGGEAVGRLPDGRACFVARALPGETVEVRVTAVHKRHATAQLVRVVTPSPHRVDPPCPHYDHCGGCQLQHAAPAHQLELKARVLVEQLQRIGRQPSPPVRGVIAPDGAWPDGYRTWARMAVDPEGRLGFRRWHSHEVEPIDRCLLLTDRAQGLRDALGDGWSGAAEVQLTAGDDADVVTVTADPDAPAGPAEPAPDGPHGLAVRPSPRAPATVVRPPATVRVWVGGRTLQASAGAFFQSGPGTAAALVDAVKAVADVRPGDWVLDLYAGVGLLSAALAAAGGAVVAVEADAAAAADAEVNLAGVDAEVRQATVEAALGDIGEADVVVLDPPRRGARPDVCRRIASLGARQIVYVACDPAALARDTRVLVGCGYELESVDGLDLFGHTAHVEAVASFRRAA